MTVAADGSMMSWSPVTWHALLGEQPTVTRTFARDVSRGSTSVFAPTCRLGACHPPRNVVRRGAGAGVCVGRLVGVGVVRGRGARVDVDGDVAPEPVRTGPLVFGAGDVDAAAVRRAVAVADGDSGVGVADGNISAGPVAIGVGHALTSGAGDAG
ncbi:MAG TPA: hypothetical protein DCQ36_14115 [Actinobacteria bacterium]|nr:hypothetical protein [Actinomycetota bacterium]